MTDLLETNLFGEHPDAWRNEWVRLPAFEQPSQEPWQTITVEFTAEEDVAAFEKLIGARLYHDKWTWYPPRGYGKWRNKEWTGGSHLTRYPIYVISKGRADTPLTHNALHAMHVPHWVVIEPQEYPAYARTIAPGQLLVLPFSNLGQGSIPARNWVWQHSIDAGHRRHWIMDDNLDGFYRLHQNAKRQVKSAVPFRVVEDFADRYTNVQMAGLQYESFAPRRQACDPYTLNTRIYSCILLDNSVTHRWRGRYNEDTDLSLRILKDGACTVLVNAFLANKCATMRMAGGNTDELYQGDGRQQMAQSLVDQHPDVASITWKWGRWQHHVDYSRFKGNQLQRRPGVTLSPGVDEYGLQLTDTAGHTTEEQT